MKFRKPMTFKTPMKFKIATAIVLSLAPAAAGAADLTVFTEDNRPFNYMDKATNKVAGLSTDILLEAFKKAGVSYDLQLTAWSRAYGAALNQPNTCVYSTTVTEERKPLFKWVAPITSNDWVLVARKGAPMVDKLDALKGKRIGGYVKDAKAHYLKQQGMNVDEASDDSVNPKKLVAGRIDYWATTNFWKTMVDPATAAKLEQVLLVKKVDYGLACNKSVPDALIAKIKAALPAH